MTDVALPGAVQATSPKTKPRYLPGLRTDLILQVAPADKDGSPNWVLHDPIAGKYLKLGWLEHEVLKHWRLQLPQKIANAVNRETTLSIGVDDVEKLGSTLLRIGMLRADWRSLSKLDEARKGLIEQNASAIFTSQVLFPKIPLVRPQRFLDATYPAVAPLLTKGFARISVLVFVLALFLVSRQWSEFVSTFSFLFTFEGIFASVLALASSKILHELAHAYVSKKYGSHVPSMGVAFLVFFPVLFTETSDAWMIPNRRARIAIAAAGIISEMVLAAFALLAWSLLDDGPLRSAMFVLASTVWIMSLLVNLNPLVRFDGYFILSEALGVENMATRASALGRYTIRSWWTGHRKENPEQHTTKQGRYWLHVYFYAMIIYRVLLYAAIVGTILFLFPSVVAVPAVLIVIGNFVIRPIMAEYKNASHLASEQGRKGFAIRTLLLAILVGLLLLVPFRTTYTGWAIVAPGESLEIFAPEPALIVSLGLKNGDTVKEGDVVAALTSPELVTQISGSSVRAKSLEKFLQRQITNESYRESQAVQLEQLMQVRAERNGYLERQRALSLRASTDGVVTNVMVDARPGRWVDNAEPIATIIASGGNRIDAYFDEAEIGRIPIGSTGILMIDGLPDKEFDVVLQQIAPTGQQVLSSISLASIYGGPIPVRQDASGRLIPERGIYLARFDVEGHNLFRTLPNRELRGSIRIKAKSSSLANVFYRKANSLLLRETGLSLPAAPMN